MMKSSTPNSKRDTRLGWSVEDGNEDVGDRDGMDVEKGGMFGVGSYEMDDSEPH